MYKQYFCSRPYALHAWLLGGAILVLLTGAALCQFFSNYWKGDFYAELERTIRDSTHNSTSPTEEYYVLARRYVWLNLPLPFLNALTYLATGVWSISWRHALTDDYLARYARRSSELELEGVSQRIQEDTRNLSVQINRIGNEIFGAFVMICVFAPLLYDLSPPADSTAGYGVPGVLLWFVVVGNVAGILISLVIGRPLVSLQYNIEKQEAAYRKELVFAEDQPSTPGSLLTWQALFRAVKHAYYRLYAYQSAFNLWIGTFDSFMNAMPIFLLAPAIFANEYSLNKYIQAQDAFRLMHHSVAVVAHMWPDINDVRCIVRRLRELEERLDGLDQRPDEKARLVSPSAGGGGSAVGRWSGFGSGPRLRST